MPTTTCRARRFCACTACRALAFDTEGGARRGTPLSIADERDRTSHPYTPTHRKDS